MSMSMSMLVLVLVLVSASGDETPNLADSKKQLLSYPRRASKVNVILLSHRITSLFSPLKGTILFENENETPIGLLLLSSRDPTPFPLLPCGWQDRNRDGSRDR